jgi:predicted NUDIX family NTP pyrophosphohydrolase
MARPDAKRKIGAGLLLFRQGPGTLEVLLAHPGGPYWAAKDAGAWSIPKGGPLDGEDTLTAAKREFEEEMGSPVDGDFIALEPVKQPGGKTVFAWAVHADFDVASLRSNTFSMEWPPRSGQHQEFPEVDRAGWFAVETARRKLSTGQAPLIDQLVNKLR